MHRPRGFDLGNHRSHRYDWTTLDRAIDLTRAAGMKVMLSVTGPGAAVDLAGAAARTTRATSRTRTLFALFAQAVATRYRDRVDRYLIWNEPNIAGWLEPQQTCVARRVCVPASPHIYRGLVRAARPAIERADPGAQVLLGELAPRGHRAISTRSPVSPLPFLRELACVDRRYKRMRRGPCRGFKPARADAFGYHPHGVEFGPEDPNPDRDQAQIGDLPRLFSVLDRLTRMGRIVAPRRKFDVYLTEFSYQTSPPDHEVGVSLGRQARYLQQAAYLAWRLPRVRNLTQYQWRDEPVIVRGRGVKSYSGWQSGLRYVNDKPKPAMRAFLRPFVIDARPARAGRDVLGPDPAGERRADGHGAAAAAGPEGVPAGGDGADRRARLLDAAAAAPAAGEVPLLVGGGRRDRGRRSHAPAVRRRRGRERSRPPVARVAVSDFREFYTEGYSLPDRGRGRADGALAGARGALEGRPRRDAVRPRRGCGRARSSRSAAATGRCWPSWRRAGSRRCSTASSSPRRPPSWPGRAGVARRVEVFDGLTVPAEDSAYDLAVLSHVLEHVPEPMSLLREAARVAPAVLVEVPLEDNRSAAREEKRDEAARIGHVQFFDRAAVRSLFRVAGLDVRRRALRPAALRPPRVLR